MAEIRNIHTENKSYITTVSYRTTMSLIKKLQQITMAVYMVTDCVEDGEPLRYRTRESVLEAMKSVSSVLGSVQTNSSAFRSAHGSMVIVREHITLLEVMGYVSKMNSSILVTEIDKFIASLDTSILDTDSPHKSRVPMRSDMSFGIDLGQIFYKQNEILKDNNQDMSVIKESEQPTPEKALGKIEREMGRLKRKSIILKIFRELPSVAGERDLTLNEIVAKYSRYGGEGQIGEKTIQRELGDMIKDGTLSKIGSKRWVKYRLVHSA